MKQAKFLSGFLLGTVLFGSSSALASGIWAEKSSQNVLADGKKINIEAYNINGNNYVKLRDIAQAADFKVWYDAEKGIVEIDSTEPYGQDEATSNIEFISNEETYHIPQAGEIITADNDDYRYEITDVSRYSNSMFSMGKIALPKLNCDRNLFPKLALPNRESRHFSTKDGEYLFVRNLYEMRRMEYTMYNFISINPQSWQDGKPALKADGTPLVKIGFDVGAKEVYNFWPFRESEMAKLFNEWASGTFELEAWDVYKDGASNCWRCNGTTSILKQASSRSANRSAWFAARS